MSVVYEPKGKAREYSPLALNVYMGCTHRCEYCYAPNCIHKRKEDYFIHPSPRKNIVPLLKEELKSATYSKQVMLSFVGDVYCETAPDDYTPREILKLLKVHSVPVAILTKGGKRCLKDLDMFKSFGEHIHVGVTLTFMDEAKSLEWESGAALPEDRLETLRTLKENGVTTFVSFEPVIEPEESIKLIKRTLADDSVDIYKIGKLNNFRGLDKKINWNDFLRTAVDLIRPSGKKMYIKKDLREAASSVELFPNEIDSELYCAV